MSDFEFIIASNFYSKITDGTHDSPKQKSTGKPLITSKHIKGRNIDFENAYFISEEDFNKINERSQVEKWDVIISMIGEYCGFSYIERNDVIDYAVKNVGLFKTGNRLEAEWLFYYLNSSVGKQLLKKARSGSSQPYLTLNGLRELPILQPVNKNVKIKIAKVLSDLDTKIELNNKINTELEAMAKLIYDCWFVQFDFPNEDGLPYKSSGGKMVWSEELKREIPEGWEVKELGEISEIKAGGDKPFIISETKSEINQIPIYSNGIINEGHYGYTSDAKILKPSITVSARGTIGYCVLRLTPYVPIIRLISITPQKEFELVYWFQNIKRLQFENSGSVQQQLTVPQISKLKVLFPYEVLMKRFYNLTYSNFIKIEKNKIENQKLSELRDWLLPMLMNGQVKVK